jgi:hypothetical protein
MLSLFTKPANTEVAEPKGSKSLIPKPTQNPFYPFSINFVWFPSQHNNYQNLLHISLYDEFIDLNSVVGASHSDTSAT